MPRALPSAQPLPIRLAASAPSACALCAVRSLTFCDGLERHELDRLSAIVTRLKLEDGRHVFQEGDAGENIYNLTKGAVKLYKLLPDGRRQITGFLLPGDFLGLSGPDGYSYSAETIEPTELCRFPRKRLDALFNEFPLLERRMLKLATDELIAAQDQMVLLGRRTAVERLAFFLLRLSERERVRGASGNPVLLPMTRGDIADYLGLTIETISRTLSQFKKQGLLKQHSLTLIELMDRARLAEIAEL